MSAKHTPGPWHTSLLYYSDIPENGRVVICAAPKSSQHAHTRVGEAAFSPERSDYYVCNRDEAEANARLMAVAPKLLSIAERWAALDGGAWHVQRHANEKAELLADTAAAIAAATGEQP